MATLTNERGHIGASAISLQRRLDAMAAMGGADVDAVRRDELAGLLAAGTPSGAGAAPGTGGVGGGAR